MRGARRSGKQSRDDSRRSAIESLSDEAIKRQLRADAMKHPATLVPLALFILFIILLVFGPWWFIILAIGLAVVSAGSFFWRYSIRFNAEYEKRVQELLKDQDLEASASGTSELQRLREDIQTGFSRVNSAEGLKALQELIHEYEQLQPVLERGKVTDPLAVAHIPALAEETYRQGLGVLVGCLDLMREIRSPNNIKLEAEVGDLEGQIRSMEGDDSQAERLSILRATVASHKERLGLVQQQRLRVDGLLQQSDSCEASLHRTRIELAALKADSVDASVSTVTNALQSTIVRAKEVQEELKRLGY